MCSAGSKTGGPGGRHLIATDDEDAGGGDDGDPVGAVAVQDVAGGAVEQPALAVAAGGDTARTPRSRRSPPRSNPGASGANCVIVAR